jgi:N-acyl-D-amino-acid deacylase
MVFHRELMKTLRLFRGATRVTIGAAVALSASPTAPLAEAQSAPTTYDIILRGGTVVDGTGAARYRADVAITGGFIVRVGDLSRVRARTNIDVRGLMVAPGFINIHSHAVPWVLPTAENMLTQGVTSELLNADGAGPLDIGAQIGGYAEKGLAVNIAASIGFNSVWSSVMGPSNTRPTAANIEKMRALVLANLDRGAFGVSAGLDYKPAYFATVPEVIEVLSPARPWRTFFPNHDRLAPETGFSSRKGMEETMAIGDGTGLVPVFTHMKVQGHEQGSAPAILNMMRAATAAGRWVAADVYPYLAGQTALAALIIPGWAQDGGTAKMRERFADSTLRSRIIVEADQAIAARFNGAESILLNETGRRLSDVMRQQGAKTPGEAVVKILETESPSAILSFGAEADLLKILQYPDAVIACDCGAWLETRAHPRGFGTFPRILGHYVRETRTLTWEQAVRKMSGLPASLIGLVDRGFIAPGMAADIAVFDTSTVIDRATYEVPNAKSEGIRFVLVNGVVALRDGDVTGARGGVAMRRTGLMPSRPLRVATGRRITASGTLTQDGVATATSVTVDIRQPKGARAARGVLRLVTTEGDTARALSFGVVQTGDDWATVSGILRMQGRDRAFTAIFDRKYPLLSGTPPFVMLQIQGFPNVAGTISGATAMSLK